MVLTRSESETLRSICDAFFPSLAEASGDGFYRRKASDFGVPEVMADVVETRLAPGLRDQLIRLLKIIESPFYNLLLTGVPVRFSGLDARGKERYLQRWRDSLLGSKRTAFQALKRLSCFASYTVVAQDGMNPNWKEIGFPGPQHLPRAATERELTILPFVPNTDQVTCDVCVVGSGAGGSVIADELSRSGLDVVVVEEGDIWNSESFKQDELTMMGELYQQHGTAGTADLGLTLLGGRGVGGGTIVNWNTCLRPPRDVLSEWETEFGVDGLLDGRFEGFLDEVWSRLRVSTESSDVNRNNGVLRDGCVALGYAEGTDFETIPRNAVGCEERCDFCNFGCVYSCKQATYVNYLSSAFRQGVRFLTRSRAETIVLERGAAAGVEVSSEGGKRLRVRSRAVVVCCGGIETPALLLRSGIRENGVGDHLRLDPTAAIGGVFAEEIAPWRGPPQTIVVRKFWNIDGTRHGFWIEAAPAHPGLFAYSIPWQGGKSHKDFMRNTYARSSASIVLLREWGSGKVRVDKRGFPVVHYKLDARDKTNLTRGMAETARILAAAGAEEVWTLHNDPVRIGEQGRRLTSNELDSFESEVRSRGISANRISIFSAHLMGSCRMASNQSLGPCSPTGELYGVENLFIGDACVFPTTPAVNPMITVMAMARRTSESVKSKLRTVA